MLHDTVPGFLQAVRIAFSRYLLHGIPLPAILKQYGHILAALITGVGSATALHDFIQRNRKNSAKAKLALLHVMRCLHDTPELEARLTQAEQLAADMDEQVLRLVGTHLSENEAVATVKQSKRKVLSEAEEQRDGGTKRQKHSASEEEVNCHGGCPVEMTLSGQADGQNTVRHEHTTPTQCTTYPPETRPHRPSYAPQTPDSPFCSEDPPRSVGRTYKMPSASPSPAPNQSADPAFSNADTEDKASTPPHNPRRTSLSYGYGLNYDDPNLYSDIEGSPPRPGTPAPNGHCDPDLTMEAVTPSRVDGMNAVDRGAVDQQDGLEFGAGQAEGEEAWGKEGVEEEEDKEEDEPEQMEVDWPDVYLTCPIDDDNFAVDIHTLVTPPYSIGSPPSAYFISPALPSPSNSCGGFTPPSSARSSSQAAVTLTSVVEEEERTMFSAFAVYVNPDMTTHTTPAEPSSGVAIVQAHSTELQPCNDDPSAILAGGCPTIDTYASPKPATISPGPPTLPSHSAPSSPATCARSGTLSGHPSPSSSPSPRPKKRSHPKTTKSASCSPPSKKHKSGHAASQVLRRTTRLAILRSRADEAEGEDELVVPLGLESQHDDALHTLEYQGSPVQRRSARECSYKGRYSK
jgi:hypothetical protein